MRLADSSLISEDSQPLQQPRKLRIDQLNRLLGPRLDKSVHLCEQRQRRASRVALGLREQFIQAREVAACFDQLLGTCVPGIYGASRNGG